MDYTELRQYRDKDDLRLYQLADILHIHPSYLNKLENGHQKNIKNYRKRESVERWLKNARRRYARIDSAKKKNSVRTPKTETTKQVETAAI